MYYEEVDFCFRLWEAGWEVHYAPTAEVVHVGAASTSQVRTAMAVRHFESTRRFYRRHYSGFRAGLWMGLMRFKMAFRLLRDSIALPFAKGERRQRLKEQLAAWRLTLLSRGGE
jgi:GT2 family glycosyltransferase